MASWAGAVVLLLNLRTGSTTEIYRPGECRSLAHWGARGRWFSRRPQAVTAPPLILNLGAVNRDSPPLRGAA